MNKVTLSVSPRLAERLASDPTARARAIALIERAFGQPQEVGVEVARARERAFALKQSEFDTRHFAQWALDEDDGDD